MFIVFEGVDRAGKTTQVNRLVAHLESKKTPCKVIKFPNRTTEIGQLLDKFLRSKRGKFNLPDKVAHLLFSANRWETMLEVQEDLKAGVTVIADRYVFSAQAYGDVTAENAFWYQQADVGLPTPDMVLLLDVADTSTRDGYGGERYENQEFLTKVRAKFLGMVGENWRVLDASRPMDDVSAEILALYEAHNK